VTIKSQGHSI